MTPLVYRLLLGLLTMAAVAGGVFFAVRASSSSGISIQLPTATPTPEVRVYVSGAVREPWVYTLGPGDRVADALKAAKGATVDADLARVNLALRLHDQDHIHVPQRGEQVPVTSQPTRVNINTAPAAVLATLPGIGPVKAAAIVEYREANGAFVRVDQLMQVQGIWPAIYEQLRDLVTVE